GAEDVAAVKCLAYGLQEIMFSGNVTHAQPLGAVIDERHHTVVWGEKHVLLVGDQNGTPLRSHTRINNDEMNSIRRKIGRSVSDRQRAVKYVERRNGVADVHNLRLRVDAENHALHRADKMIVQTEVRSDGNQAAHWASL